MGFFRKIGLAFFVTAVLLLAMAMAGLRLVVSNIDFFEAEISYLLEREVSKGIVFNRVSGAMNRFNPVLRIDNVSINLPDRSQPLFVDRLEVEFDFWSSLWYRAAVVHEISGELEKLEMTRDAAGQWWINEYRIDLANAADFELPGFSQVLELLPRYLKLDLRRLIVHDELHQSIHQLTRVAARIVHRKGRFFTQVSAALPDEFGQGVLVKSVVDERASLFYLNTSELKLAPLARLFDIDTMGLKSGTLDGELWVDMSEYRVTGMQGDLDLREAVLQVAGDKPDLAIDYHARFDSSGDERRWRIVGNIERLTVDGEAVPEFAAQFDIPLAADDDRLAAAIDSLPISSLPAIAGQWLPNEVGRQIAQGRLQGRLHDLLFEIELEQAQAFRLGARVTDLSNAAFGRFPGIDKVDAQLIMGRNKLVATITGNEVSVDFGDEFRAPLQADSLSLEVLLNRMPSGNLLVEADNIRLHNADANLVGRLQLETDGDQAPFMFLRASFSDAIAASTGKYVPVQLMPKQTIEWLDRGIISGFVPYGDLQFHGRLRDIQSLTRDWAGEFFVDFRVEQANIRFAPGWLNARDGYGRVLFHNMGVEFDLERASYERIGNVRARGAILDFSSPSLELDIAAETSAQDGLRVWRNTPVGQPFEKVLAKLQDVGGEVGSEIRLNLPLDADLGEPEVDVRVDFKDAAVRAPDWGLELARITGRLKVTERTAEAADISARFFGDPIRIDVASIDTARSTEVSVQGKLASGNLLRRLPDFLSEPVSGDSDWQIRLQIAGADTPPEQPYLRITAASNLRDTRVDLPVPFFKPAAEVSRFSADVNFHAGRIQFESALGGGLRGRGTIRETVAGEYRMDSMDIAFNSMFPGQRQRGVNIYGRIAQLPLNQWLEFLRKSGNEDPARLNYMLLGVDRGEAFGHQFSSAVIELKQADGHFYGQIDSSIARGNFEAPVKPSDDDPIILNLNFLVVDKVAGESDHTTMRPADLPAFQLNCESLVYHGMSVNDVRIETRPRSDGLLVQRFDMRLHELQFASKGRWRYDEASDSHSSNLRVSLKGPNLGEAISGLGFGDSMSRGEVDFQGQFKWPAPLLAFDPETVSGHAELDIRNGVLNNVDPGSGRYVGLLSLSALPRRLSLDFSDVVIEGMDFEEIDGSYRIEDGVLYTEDTRMEGPAAKIKISGKTGIIRRDYDQVIRVIPNIRETLPLIGAISAGSTVGWGLLLLQNLFKTVIEDAVEVEYHVTGSWDDPQIELIKAVDENQRALPKIDK